MQKHAALLGYMGLIPFILLPFMVSLELTSFYEGISFFNQYSAIILSFLGGIWWSQTLQSQRTTRQLYYAIFPSLLIFMGLVFLPSEILIWVTLVSFLAMLAFELKAMELQEWYIRLRINLTTIVTGCHLMMLWLIYTPM